MSAAPCLEAFAAILTLLAATGWAVALLGARRVRRRRREAFARAPLSVRPPPVPPRAAPGLDLSMLPRAPSYADDEEPETVVLPPRGGDVRFAPAVRTVSPDSVTKPYPPSAPPPAQTLATVKGDAFHRAIEEERRSLRHRKEKP